MKGYQAVRLSVRSRFRGSPGKAGESRVSWASPSAKQRLHPIRNLHSAIHNRRESRQSDSNRRPADYKSAALPAELCRLLRGKILSHAASASPFLYAFSIRQGLTPFATSFWTRPEHTGTNSHRFGAAAMTQRLPAWSGDGICPSNAGRMGERL
jgi:hypothetical protein